MIDYLDEPHDTSYEDGKAYDIAKDEAEALGVLFVEWAGENYMEEFGKFGSDDFLQFCTELAKNERVVESYYYYRRNDIVSSIDWS